jgi:SET domain-containing protein
VCLLLLPSACSAIPCRIDGEWVADATVRGGRARFINHSCDPNCYTKIFTIDGTRKIGIYAKRAIALGQELAYDYKVRAMEQFSILLALLSGAGPMVHLGWDDLPCSHQCHSLCGLPHYIAYNDFCCCCVFVQFDFEEDARKVPCACGAKNCRGFMN